MKKIVHIIDTFMLGGAEVLLFSTIKRLPQFEHHVILLVDAIHIREVEKHARLYCVHHSGWHQAIRTCRRLRKLVQQLQPDVVHTHLFLSSLLARWALGTRYNLVYSIHSIYSSTIFKKPWQRTFERLAYNSAHKLVAVSNYVLEDYRKVVTACKGGYVLYNLIEDAFVDDAHLKKLPAPARLHKWVAVGSLKWQKNYERLIPLFETFYKTAQEKEKLSLDIYGDGPLRAALAEQIKRRGLPIYLKGSATGLAALLKNYDAYISTSRFEGYGIAPMEALAIGLPVFLNSIPVYQEIYKDHAFFFDADDPNAVTFSKAHAAYERMTAAEKEELSVKGQEYAAATAGSNSYLQKLLAIYGIEAI